MKAKGGAAPVEERIREIERELSLKKPLILCAALLLLFAFLAGSVLTSGVWGGAQAGGAAQPAVLLQQRPIDTRRIVVVDAGHGGVDTGAQGVGGVVETDITPVLAEKVLALLAQHPDAFLGVPSHTFGATVSVADRAGAAVRLNADLLVSLHLNADTSSRTHGFQVFPAPPGRQHHAASLRFARLLVGQARGTGVRVLGQSGVYYAYYPKIPGGYRKYLVEAEPADAGPPPAHESFGVVDDAGCPAVLAELWHITGTRDAALFHSEAGYDAMARCVYLAICEYFGVTPL